MLRGGQHTKHGVDTVYENKRRLKVKTFRRESVKAKKENQEEKVSHKRTEAKLIDLEDYGLIDIEVAVRGNGVRL